MSIKRADSLRSLGLTQIAVDKGTRAKLKQAAGDMPLSEYLKLIAEAGIKNAQGGLPGSIIPAGKPRDTSAQVGAICQSIIHMAEVVPMADKKREAYVSIAGKFARYEMLDQAIEFYDKLRPEYEKEIERESALDAGQLRLVNET